MTGLMLHTSGKRFIRKQMFTEALEVLTMGEVSCMCSYLYGQMIYIFNLYGLINCFEAIGAFFKIFQLKLFRGQFFNLHIILFQRFLFINLSQFPLFFIFPLLVYYNWHCAPSFQNFSHTYETIFRLTGCLFWLLET